MPMIKLFQWAKHVSGMPYARCSSCKGHINIQEKVTAMETPKVYGVMTPTRTINTHEALYWCKCGRTQIVVEGTMEEYEANGCILTKVEKT